MPIYHICMYVAIHMFTFVREYVTRSLKNDKLQYINDVCIDSVKK